MEETEAGAGLTGIMDFEYFVILTWHLWETLDKFRISDILISLDFLNKLKVRMFITLKEKK